MYVLKVHFVISITLIMLEQSGPETSSLEPPDIIKQHRNVPVLLQIFRVGTMTQQLFHHLPSVEENVMKIIGPNASGSIMRGLAEIVQQIIVQCLCTVHMLVRRIKSGIKGLGQVKGFSARCSPTLPFFTNMQFSVKFSINSRSQR